MMQEAAYLHAERSRATMMRPCKSKSMPRRISRNTTSEVTSSGCGQLLKSNEDHSDGCWAHVRHCLDTSSHVMSSHSSKWRNISVNNSSPKSDKLVRIVRRLESLQSTDVYSGP
eukprot:2148949-Pyramimonas_sp.AAC.2